MARVSIGLDIGQAWVRAVAVAPPSAAEAREGARARVLGFASTARRDAAGGEKALATVLGEIEAQLGRRGPAVVHAAGLSVLVRYLASLPLPPDRLGRLLRLELVQHADAEGGLCADAVKVPIAGDELIHCCAVAQPAQVEELRRELDRAGWSGARLHHGPVALFNASLPSAPVRGDDLALLVDIGAASTSVCLLGEDRFLASRSLPLGGEAFTAAGRGEGPVAAGQEAFRGELQLDDEAPPPSASSTVATAIDLGPTDGAGAPPPGLATMVGARETMGPAMARVAESLYQQLASALQWFRGQLKRDSLKPGAILLCGGGSALPGLADYLGRRFSLPVRIFDPFTGQDGAPAIAGPRPERPWEWVTALGLALSPRRLGGPWAVALDLVPERRLLREHRLRRVVWPYLAAACLLLAAVFAGLVLHEQNRARRTSIDQGKQYRRDWDDLKRQLLEAEAERNALGDDLRAIASRIYAGRDMLLVIRALKENAGTRFPEIWVNRLTYVQVDREGNPVGLDDEGYMKGLTGPPEAVVQRGAALVEARIKLSASTLDAERTGIMERYQKALEQWRSEPGADPLFAGSRVRYRDWEHRPAAPGAPLADNGTFRFGLLFYFAPVRLDRPQAAIPPPSQSASGAQP